MGYTLAVNGIGYLIDLRITKTPMKNSITIWIEIRDVLLLSVMLFMSGCGKEDDNDLPHDGNAPPATFNLIEIASGAKEIELYPFFSWAVATDPDGDKVSYDLYLDTAIDPGLYEADISSNSFQIMDKLHLDTKYYWKVVANDGRGGESQSPIQVFTTRTLKIPEIALNPSADFTLRANHTTTVFGGQLWVIGGNGINTPLSDIWVSAEGADWEMKFHGSHFSGRTRHTSVEFDNRIWVIGGSDGNNFLNDVWYSHGGTKWTLAAGTAQFSARHDHTTALFDGRLWVIGGVNATSINNDVWSSADGTDWTEHTAAASFSGRYGHTLAVFDGKLWVIGGDDGNTYKNDVWYSENGADWTQATASASFPGRSGHTTVVYDGKLWVIGGTTETGRQNDVWSSTDGIAWKLVTQNAPFSERHGHTSTIFEGKLWVIGGIGAQRYNDVWVMD
jgi:hypothetical protein